MSAWTLGLLAHTERKFRGCKDAFQDILCLIIHTLTNRLTDSLSVFFKQYTTRNSDFIVYVIVGLFKIQLIHFLDLKCRFNLSRSYLLIEVHTCLWVRAFDAVCSCLLTYLNDFRCSGVSKYIFSKCM